MAGPSVPSLAKISCELLTSLTGFNLTSSHKYFALGASLVDGTNLDPWVAPLGFEKAFRPRRECRALLEQAWGEGTALGKGALCFGRSSSSEVGEIGSPTEPMPKSLGLYKDFEP